MDAGALTVVNDGEKLRRRVCIRIRSVINETLCFLAAIIVTGNCEVGSSNEWLTLFIVKFGY